MKTLTEYLFNNYIRKTFEPHIIYLFILLYLWGFKKVYFLQ